MNAARPPRQPTTRDAISSRGIRLRLLAAMAALGAGVAALLIAILLLRNVLA
jgi:hypothetical protein